MPLAVPEDGLSIAEAAPVVQTVVGTIHYDDAFGRHIQSPAEADIVGLAVGGGDKVMRKTVTIEAYVYFHCALDAVEPDPGKDRQALRCAASTRSRPQSSDKPIVLVLSLEFVLNVK